MSTWGGLSDSVCRRVDLLTFNSFLHFISYFKGQKTFSRKNKKASILGFAGHEVSVRTIQLCHCSINKWYGCVPTKLNWASLVVQWLRICLAKQRTPVQSLVQEDFPMMWGDWAHLPKACAPQTPWWEGLALQLESSPLSPKLEKVFTQQWRSNVVKKKKKKL